MKLTFTKDDFKVDFFRAQGKGGQNVNKRETACRITHLETGISTTSQVHRTQPRNLKEAWSKMRKLLAVHYAPKPRERYAAGQETTRTYKETKDLVIDHVTGKKYSYKHTVGKGDISVIIEDRIRHGQGS
jgi:protein subunit release factor B